MPKYTFVEAGSGQQQEVDLDVSAYEAAGNAGLSLSEYLETEYPSDSAHGTTMEQMMQSCGMFLRSAPGIRPPTMAQVLNGNVQIDAAGITRGDGPGSTPGSRLLFPEVILQVIRTELDEDNSDFLGGYNNMIATTQNVTTPRVEQPVIDVTAPRGAESANQPIAQLAEPARMITITTADKSVKIQTRAVGLTISDEALQTSTLDLVGIAMTQQARQERIRIVEEQLNGMISGDVDVGYSTGAVTNVNSGTYDATAITAATFSQTAWIKFLRANYKKMTVTNIIMDIDTALAVENRLKKPNVQNDDPTSPRLDTLFTVDNLGLSAPRVLLVDTAIVGADTMIGIDRRYAIRRIVNVSASYSAIEQYVMRRATSFRVDYGEVAHRLMDDAWHKMTIAAA